MNKNKTSIRHYPTCLMITGGAGFIGTNFVRYILREIPKIKVIVVDALTYAGNIDNLALLKENYKDRYEFIQSNINDTKTIESILFIKNVDTIVHFAAESHVDRSINDPFVFIETNIIGTYNLLRSAQKVWKDRQDVRFHHVSTDEVFGSLNQSTYFTELTPYNPSNPYSASKASADHFVRVWYKTFQLPCTISNCSNNYGPYQFPEKLIPLMILNALKNKPLPIYGNGKNIRDWLFVEDHCKAIWTIIERGETGQTYNIGGSSELTNLEVVKCICREIANVTGKKNEEMESLITFVKDRPGHDLRYAIDYSKIQSELGWKPLEQFSSGIKKTIQWYITNPHWIEKIQNKHYNKWIEKNYENR